MAKRRTFTAAFKARVAKEALRGDKTVRQIATKHRVHPNQVSQWKRKASEGLVQLYERGEVPAFSWTLETCVVTGCARTFYGVTADPGLWSMKRQ